MAWYFLPEIPACRFFCKNLIFLISIPNSNLSQSPILLLSSMALRMLPSLVPSAVFINLLFATSPRTLMRLFSNGSSKPDPEISLNNEILSPAQLKLLLPIIAPFLVVVVVSALASKTHSSGWLVVNSEEAEEAGDQGWLCTLPRTLLQSRCNLLSAFL